MFFFVYLLAIIVACNLCFYIIVPTKHDSFSFERNNSMFNNKVEHPRYEVWMRNGAELAQGFVGNTSSLSGKL